MLNAFTWVTGHWREMLYGMLAGMGLLMLLLMFLVRVPVSYNLRNLIVRWKTALMTAMAFTIVTGLMTMMMAFVNGMFVLTQGSAQPGNVVILARGSNDESFSNLAFADVNNIALNPAIISDANDRRMASKEIYVVANQQVPLGAGQKPRRRFVQIRGLEDAEVAIAVHGIKLQNGGKLFSTAGIEEAGEKTGSLNLIQAVLGSGLAAEMGKDRPGGAPLVAGDTFPLADRTWKVVGVLDSQGSTFDSEIWAKLQLVGEQFGKKNNYSSFVVRTKGEGEAKALADTLKESKDVAVNALTEKEYFSNLEQNSKVLLYAIMIVAGVMGVGGAFGVMNTMFAAISQRIKDIGVLRIIGFPRRQVLISFLLESLCLALIGGLIGCAFGCLANGWSTKSIVGGGGGGGKTIVLQMKVSIEILAAGLLMSLWMGLIGGLLPAISAMRLRALESLR